MILVDTSVWVDHLRSGNARLQELLSVAGVWCHPFIVGELACGNLARREEVLGLLTALPQLQVQAHEDVLQFVRLRRLSGLGLGWLDMHLLASACVDGAALWTLDKRLERIASRLGATPA